MITEHTVKPRLVDLINNRMPRGLDSFSLARIGGLEPIDPCWRVFGGKLDAVGFSPDAAVISTLQNKERSKTVLYENRFIFSDDYNDNLFPWRSRYQTPTNFSHDRSSSFLFLNTQDFSEKFFEKNNPLTHQGIQISLDNYAKEKNKHFDFLHIETDDNGYPVLLGAKNTIRQSVLGVLTRFSFHGWIHEHASVHSNIDLFLRKLGFSLVSLETQRFSRKTLPLPFAFDEPTETEYGPVQGGEALYLRDLILPDYDKRFGFDVTAARVLKMASLYDIFLLPDCAIELLQRYADDYHYRSHVDLFTNALTPKLNGRSLSYKRYMGKITGHPELLYPKNEDEVRGLIRVLKLLNPLMWIWLILRGVWRGVRALLLLPQTLFRVIFRRKPAA